MLTYQLAINAFLSWWPQCCSSRAGFMCKVLQMRLDELIELLTKWTTLSYIDGTESVDTVWSSINRTPEERIVISHDLSCGITNALRNNPKHKIKRSLVRTMRDDYWVPVKKRQPPSSDPFPKGYDYMLQHTSTHWKFNLRPGYWLSHQMCSKEKNARSRIWRHRKSPDEESASGWMLYSA